ncbi:MAG: histidine kinase [Gemmatimonadetes bacterium]|nr:histidine kinase [Gemmatimonadota bacterium]
MATNGTQDQERRHTGEWRAAAGEATRLERAALTRAELLLIVAFWTFMAILTAANGLLDPRARMVEPVIVAAPVVLAFIVSYAWAILTPGIFLLVDRYPIERAASAKNFILLTLAGVCVGVAMDAFGAWLRFGVFYTGGRRPPPPFGPMVTVEHLFFLDDFVVFIAVAAAAMARVYSRRVRARQEETVRLQAHAAQLQATLQGQLAEARLAALRSQIDPHFLFNTLNAVSSLVERDPKGVRRMIARLSELLRLRLEGANEPETTLDRELDTLSRYLEIMQIRFQKRLEVVMDIATESREALVPTLVLQPLVENAIKHGLSQNEAGGRLEIGAHVDGARVVLTVRDNGGGIGSSNAEGDGIGVRNTRERLQQLYGDDHSFTLRNADGGGAIATVSLPFHTGADLTLASVIDGSTP